MKIATLVTVSAAALLGMAACSNAEEPAAPADAAPMAAAPADPAMSSSETIVAGAAKAPNLTTLVSAVQAAGLAETLSGTGPFTVFAPDNAAFEKIPAATRESLMQPAQKAARNASQRQVAASRASSSSLTTETTRALAA